MLPAKRGRLVELFGYSQPNGQPIQSSLYLECQILQAPVSFNLKDNSIPRFDRPDHLLKL
jgi:hypothetical protein